MSETAIVSVQGTNIQLAKSVKRMGFRNAVRMLSTGEAKSARRKVWEDGYRIELSPRATILMIYTNKNWKNYEPNVMEILACDWVVFK